LELGIKVIERGNRQVRVCSQAKTRIPENRKVGGDADADCCALLCADHFEILCR
jgi:hypothetical protein